MLTAQEFREQMRLQFLGASHEVIGRELGLSAGFVGMVLSGSREPSKAVLDAMGMERISFYQRRDEMHSSTYEYLKPTDDQVEAMAKVRSAAKAYGDALEAILPDGPDKTFVIRNHRSNASSKEKVR